MQVRETKVTYSEKHQWPTSDLFDNKDGNKGGHEIFSAVAGSQKLGKITFSKADLLIQRGCLNSLF